jgi:hypothetical protein
MKQIVVAIFFMMLLLSCVPVKSTLLHDSQSSPTLEVTDTPIDSNKLKMDGVVIEYHRSGGFAGIMESWTFYADGRVTSDDGTVYNLTAEKVSILVNEIEALGFFEMSDSSGLFSDCRDCFTYELTVKSGTRIKSVRAVDGATDTVEGFWEIVERINALLDDLMD